MPRTPRGLASVHQVRELRQQRKFVRPSAKHWGVVVFGLLGVLGVHFTCAQRGLEPDRAHQSVDHHVHIGSLGRVE